MTFKQTGIDIVHSFADGIRWMDGRLAAMTWWRVAALAILIMIAADALPEWPIISIFKHLAPFFVLFSIILKVEAGSRVKAVESERVALLQANNDRAVARAWSAKLDSHFLFNAMSTIEYLITINPEVAIKAQSSLALYLRSGLSEPDKSSVESQAKACESYLYIQSIRLAERLRYTTQWEATGPMLGRVAIGMLELAVNKTIEPKVDGGLITLQNKMDGHDLHEWIMTCPQEGINAQDWEPWREVWMTSTQQPTWRVTQTHNKWHIHLTWLTIAPKRDKD